MYCIVLYCIVLYCIVLFCIVLYCIVLYCIVFYYTVLYFIVLYCTVLYCIVLYCIVMYCILLYCIVFYCIVLYCIVLYCIVLYCIVLYCIVLYCIVLYCIVLYCIVLYCIVLYCIVLYYTVLYCIVFYCIVFYCILLYCIVLFCIVLYCIRRVCDCFSCSVWNYNYKYNKTTEYTNNFSLSNHVPGTTCQCNMSLQAFPITGYHRVPHLIRAFEQSAYSRAKNVLIRLDLTRDKLLHFPPSSSSLSHRPHLRPVVATDDRIARTVKMVSLHRLKSFKSTVYQNKKLRESWLKRRVGEREKNGKKEEHRGRERE